MDSLHTTDEFRSIKRRRSSKACTFCRTRKVKCDSAPPGPCSLCKGTGVPCVFSEFDGRKMRAKKSQLQHPLASIGETSGSSASVTAASSPFGGPPTTSTYSTPGPSTFLHDDSQYPPIPYPALMHHDQNSSYMIPHSGFHPPPLPSPIPFDIQNYFAPHDNQSSPGFDQSNSQNNNAQASEPNQDHDVNENCPLPIPEIDTDLLFGLAARLPVVQELADGGAEGSSSQDDENIDHREIDSGTDEPSDDDSKACRVTWFRPLGSTSIAPGLQSITLRLKREGNGPPVSDSPSAYSDAGDPFDNDGLPSSTILTHLLDLFFTQMHCHLPLVDREKLLKQVNSKTASSLLLNSVAAVSARFSTHSLVAKKGLNRYEYGRPFADRARSLLFPMLSFPSIDTIASLVLLAYYEFGVDSESGLWMLSGMAMRMAQDIGLHTGPGQGSEDEQRRNKLVFWSVILLDYAVCLGTGRKSSFRPNDVMMPFPTNEDFPDENPFPHVVKLCWLFFPLINLLNGNPDSPNLQEEMATRRKVYIDAYHALPPEMGWQVNNLRDQTRKGKGPIFLQLHLNFFAAVDLAHRSKDRYIGRLARPRRKSYSSSAALSSSAARTIGEILVLAEVIDPMTYICSPFVNQTLYVAGCAFAEEIQSYATSSQPASRTQSPDPAAMLGGSNSVNNGGPKPPKNLKMTPIEAPNAITKNNIDDKSNDASSDMSSSRGDGSRAFLSSVAATNLDVIRKGLEQQARYWKGVRWIEESLSQRIEGMEEVDLSMVSEAVRSYTYVNDDGFYRRSRPRSRASSTSGQ